MYEMLVGYAPFDSDSDRDRHNCILRCTIKYPGSFPAHAKDLVRTASGHAPANTAGDDARAGWCLIACMSDFWCFLPFGVLAGFQAVRAGRQQALRHDGRRHRRAPEPPLLLRGGSPPPFLAALECPPPVIFTSFHCMVGRVRNPPPSPPNPPPA